jgi:hypothetical protein
MRCSDELAPLDLHEARGACACFDRYEGLHCWLEHGRLNDCDEAPRDQGNH